VDKGIADKIVCGTGEMRSYEETLSLILSLAPEISTFTTVNLKDSLNRIVFEDISSSIEIPNFNNSAMDGWAVNCPKSILGKPGLKEFKVIGRVVAGDLFEKELLPGDAVRIFTGAQVPLQANCVIMQENCEEADGVLDVFSPITENSNIRGSGEDISTGSIIINEGTLITPKHIAALASVGVSKLPVYRKLEVGVFFTGDELIHPGEDLTPGKIYNTNEYAIEALLSEMGCNVRNLGLVGDSKEATIKAYIDLEDADLIITTGGVSVGEEDHIKSALETMGVISTWRAKIKPGKPITIGMLDSGSLAIGLPGNVVSSFVTYKLFATPFIRKMQGLKEYKNKTNLMPINFDWNRIVDRKEFSRVSINEDGHLDLYKNQMSNAISSILNSDGLAEIPDGVRLTKGDLVKYMEFN